VNQSLETQNLTPRERGALIEAGELASAALEAKVSVLIPFRGDNGGQRDRLWAWCKAQWDSMPYELVIGEDRGDGPFNISRAFNDAASRASGDVFILYGADHIPDQDRVEWAVGQLHEHPWCALYAQTAGLSATDTNAILMGYGYDKIPFTQVAPFCTSIIGIRADSWIKFDERFQGWGGEDAAWRMVLTSLYGDTPDPSGTLRCLYHEPASREYSQANFALIGEYITAEATGQMPELVERLHLA
jgi:hypothetical protein